MRLYLIGYMGCGKSSIGRKGARRGALQFVDTDAEVERAEGASIADIMHYESEEYFRRSERRALEATAEQSDVVVSTGGGLPMWSDNMQRIAELGTSVYLRRSPESILSRLSPHGRQKRPKFRGLNDEELLAFMHSHLTEREPMYARADVTIDCDAHSDEQVVDMILALFGQER